MWKLGRTPVRGAVAFVAAILLLFQAAAVAVTCTDTVVLAQSGVADHADNLSLADGAPCGGLTGTLHSDTPDRPFFPHQAPNKTPHHDCPSCAVFACHVLVIAARPAGVVAPPADGVALWFILEENASANVFQTIGARDPPLFL